MRVKMTTTTPGPFGVFYAGQTYDLKDGMAERFVADRVAVMAGQEDLERELIDPEDDEDEEIDIDTEDDEIEEDEDPRDDDEEDV